jgi:hypothetical protein
VRLVDLFDGCHVSFAVWGNTSRDGLNVVCSGFRWFPKFLRPCGCVPAWLAVGAVS